MPGPLVGCSILVVADQSFAAYCLDILLSDAGAHVQGTHSVGEAHALLERHRPSAIVLDTRSAAKADHKIRQRLLRLGIPCIVYSNDTRDDDPKTDGISVLPRPIRGTDLIEALSCLKAAGGTAQFALQPAIGPRSFTGLDAAALIHPADRST